MTEAAHSPLGPSSAKRWINCGASVKATEHLPDTESIFAMEGTAAHTLSELARCANVPVKTYKGQMIPVKKLDGTFQNFEVTQEMVDGVQEFIDHCEMLPGDAFFEVRVRYDTWVPQGFGTADDIRIDTDVCNITDLKYGKGEEIDAEDNEQLKMYALGVLHDYGYMYDIKSFNLHISQPRKSALKSFTISTEDLLKWKDEVVVPAAKMTQDPRAPFKAGDWCRWCKIRETCMVRASTNTKNMIDEFESYDDTDLSDKKTHKFKQVALMTPNQIAKLIYLLEPAKAWIKDVEKYVMSCLLQGQKIGDWKLVEGRSNRKWGVDEVLVEGLLLELRDDENRPIITEDQLFKKKMNGPAEVEKIIGKRHPLIRAIDSKENPGIVDKPPGKPKLAPGTDKRPAMDLNDLAGFESYADEDEEE